MAKLPYVKGTDDNETETKIDSGGGVPFKNGNNDKCSFHHYTSTLVPENAESLKTPAHKMPWPHPKGLLSSDRSDNDRKAREEGDSLDAWSDSDTSSIVHRGSNWKVEACLLNEDLQARLKLTFYCVPFYFKILVSSTSG